MEERGFTTPHKHDPGKSCCKRPGAIRASFYFQIPIDIQCATRYNDAYNSVEVMDLDKKELISGFVLELRRGTVVLCVLAKLQAPTYGYNLIAELADSRVAIEANTLYPLLRRLEAQGLLESEWNTDGAKPRKYYVVTAFGNEVLAEMQAHWADNVRDIQKILEGL